MSGHADQVSSVGITNIGSENYKFALHCLEEARKADVNKDVFGMWAFGRSAIISLIMSLEADLSRLIEVLLRRHIKQGISLTFDEQLLFEYLSDPTKKYNGAYKKFDTLQKKYKRLQQLRGASRIKGVPRDVKDVVEVRNQMIHYMNQYNQEAYRTDMVQRVETSIQTVSTFILEVWKVAGEPVPSWVRT